MLQIWHRSCSAVFQRSPFMLKAPQRSITSRGHTQNSRTRFLNFNYDLSFIRSLLFEITLLSSLAPTSAHNREKKKAIGSNSPSDLSQKESYRAALESLVPSLSPQGLTHTNASARESPVGRTPKPAPLTSHQSPPLGAEARVGVTARVHDSVIGHAVRL